MLCALLREESLAGRGLGGPGVLGRKGAVLMTTGEADAAESAFRARAVAI